MGPTTPPGEPLNQCSSGGVQVCVTGWGVTSPVPPSSVWEITIMLWNRGPECVAEVQGRAFFGGQNYHVFQSPRDMVEPVPLGESRVRIGAATVQQTYVDSVWVMTWTVRPCL